MFGMLREGIPPEAAAAELDALDEQRPRPATEPAPTPVRLAGFTDIFNPAGLARLLAGTMLSVAILVLLVACANVTNVLLARAAVRSREVAVMTALGASRARIATQFWIEVSLLALGGAAGGVLLTLLGIRLIRNAMSAAEGLPFWWDLRVDLPVLAFVSIAAMVAAITAGIGPAMFASRSNNHDLLKDGTRTSSSRRLGTIMRRLIGAEMAVSLVLLVAAGLFIRSAVNLQTYQFSFDPDGVYTAAVSPPEGHDESSAARAAFTERLEESLAAMPQASSAAITTALPGIGSTERTVAIEGKHLASEPGLPSTWYVAATPGFFPTFRAPALAGRLFDSRDRAGGLPVVVVSASFERLHLPQGAVGRRIALPEESGEPIWLTIVGVVPDLLAGGLDSESQDAVYVPFAQAAPTGFQIAVRSRTSADVLAAPIRQAVASVDRDATLSFMRHVGRGDRRCERRVWLVERSFPRRRWLCAGARCDRALRDHGLLGSPADPRDRATHGDRRRTRHDRWLRAASGHDAGHPRPCVRHARGAPRRMDSSRSAARGRAVRSARVRCGTRRPSVRGLARLPWAGASGDPDRTSGGARGGVAWVTRGSRETDDIFAGWRAPRGAKLVSASDVGSAVFAERRPKAERTAWLCRLNRVFTRLGIRPRRFAKTVENLVQCLAAVPRPRRPHDHLMERAAAADRGVQVL